MTFRLPPLSKYSGILHRFNADYGYVDIETAIVYGISLSNNEREVFIIQKRPHNNGRIDSIFLGYINNTDFNIERESRIRQTYERSHTTLQVSLTYNISRSTRIGGLICNYHGVALPIILAMRNNRLYMYQARREGQSSSGSYPNNIILLGSADNFLGTMLGIIQSIGSGVPEEPVDVEHPEIYR